MNEPLIDHHANVYLTQLSDGSGFFREFDEKTMLSALKINLLFFDHAAIGAVELIGNPQVHSMMENDTEALHHLYKGGHITPVLRYYDDEKQDFMDHDSMVKIAERMHISKTAAGLDPSKYMAHAEFIHSSSPACLWISDQDYKYRTASFLTHLVDHNAYYAGYRLTDDEVSAAKRLSSGLYFEEHVASISAFNEVADKVFKRESAINLKIFSETAAQYSTSSLIGSRISFHEEAVNLLPPMRKFDKIGSIIDDFTVIDTTINIDIILSLTMSELVELRESIPFVRLRRLLARLRSGSMAQSQEIKENCDYCVDVLNKFVSTSKGERGDFLRGINRHEYKRMLRATIGTLSNGALLIDLGLFVLDKSLGSVSLALSAGFSLADIVIPKRHIIIESNVSSNALYDPKEGGIKTIKFDMHQ